ncbi:ATP-binding cassette domain-containing protein [Parvibaculum sp.]|uniref:ABC transporter ATP-binding protein n=2 Tax=Parvibaculum sp. TaxID=2024848 RepID=UPI0025D43DA6|nr:ATP-binding cassette domain-containing protein [Parvibaculum sp.]
METTRLLIMRNLVKTRRSAEKGRSFILRVPDIEIRRGQAYALIGASGSGKSTFLALAAMALRPDMEGQFVFRPDDDAVNVIDLWRRRKADWMAGLRRRHIGVILQQGGLISCLSVLENILLPALLVGHDERERALSLAARLGIEGILRRRPGQVSVGQRQRVAIARALINAPDLILADEPTASVDPLTADGIFDLLVELVEETNAALVVASHDWGRVRRSDFVSLYHEIEATRESVVSTLVAA